jgi:DNA-binding SARP family transcriptional activator
MHRLNIALLGPPRILLDGKTVETDRRKAIGLLAYLAIEAKSHSREALATLLWPDYPRASTFSYLRRTLWELNQILGKDWIESDRESVSLAHRHGLEIDTEIFQKLLAAEEDQVDRLTEAASLYRGDFLERLEIADTAPFEEWESAQAEFFRHEFARCLEKLVSAHEQKARFELGLPYAQRWLSLDKLNEKAYRAVMRQMAGMGDRSGVIRVYQACSQILMKELGIAPQKETEELYKTILHEERLEARSTKVEGPSDQQSRSRNLPSPATPFIGRKEEIEQVRKLVLNQEVRLITLTGVGGTGKTRLSIQVAGEIPQSFPDGVWFIPLTAVQSLQGFILAIAEGLGYCFYKGEESPREQLLDYVREKHLLLVLDNFEQLVTSCREVIGEIMEKAPRVKLLVTSRERINMQAEQVYRS